VLPSFGGCPIGEFINIYTDNGEYGAFSTNNYVNISKRLGEVYSPAYPWQKTVPVNINEIPKGQKFCILHTNAIDNDRDQVNGTNQNDIIVYEFQR
jgi:hypothetical protein